MKLRKIMLSIVCVCLAGFSFTACENQQKADDTTEQTTTAPVEQVEAPSTDAADDAFFDSFLIHPKKVYDIGYNIRWTRDLAFDSDHTIREIAIAKDYMAILRNDNYLYSVNSQNGITNWTARIDERGEQVSNPVVFDGMTLLTAQSKLWRYDPTIGRAKPIRLAITASTAPLMVDRELAIICTANGRVYWVDLKFGFAPSNRTYQMAGGIMNDPVKAGPLVVITDVGGTVATFNARSGSIVWRKQLFDRVSTKPIATDNLIYLASEDQTLYALDRTSGNIVWKQLFEHPLKVDPQILVNKIFQFVPEKGTICFDAGTGNEQWTFPDTIIVPIQQVDQDILVWVPSEKKIKRLAIADGELISEIHTPKVDYIELDPSDGESIIVSSNSGNVMKIVPQKKLDN